MKTTLTGRLGEAEAENFLKSRGYKFVSRNYRSRGSEIDLVFVATKDVQKKELEQEIVEGKIKPELKPALLKNMENILVFVEVKKRNTDQFGKPFEAVDEHKAKRIRRGANAFCAENDLQNVSMRFDIISIEGDKITHIQNAF